MDSKIESIARAGHAAKGVVYALTGALAFGAAFSLGSNAKGKLGILEFLQNQVLGNILLLLLGIGLISYAFWRFYESIKDPERIGNDSKGIAKRIDFFISGLVYLALAIFAFYEMIASANNSSHGTDQTSSNPEIRSIIYYIISAGLAIKGIFQFVKVSKGNFLENLRIDEISDRSVRNWIKRMAYLGMISRGVVIGVIAYFFTNSASIETKNSVKGTSEAFNFLRDSSERPWLMAVVAIGFICYGFYMITLSNYRKFK
ncbi:DUF1206 domain-containing protein [Flavobacteriaceae bacterium M23B6Z8]